MRALPDHPWLDRVVRGRGWIPLLGVMLAGIVAMQVEVLKLGASIGRRIELSTALQSRNELLRASVASLADDQRIERLAAGMGMVMPAPDAVDFLAAQPDGNAAQTVRDIHAPDPAGFLALLSSSGAASAAANQPTSAASSQPVAPSSTQPGQPGPVAPAQTPASGGGGAVSPGG